MDWPASIRVSNERTSERVPNLGNCSCGIGNYSSRVGVASLAKRETSLEQELSLDSWYRIERTDRVFEPMHLARRTLLSRNTRVGNPYSTDIWFLWGDTASEITNPYAEKHADSWLVA